MTIKPVVDRKVRLAFGSAIAIMILVGAFAYYCIVVFNENNRWINHTHEVLDNLQELRFLIQSIELSSRDFVMSGDESRLKSYRTSVAQAEDSAAAVTYATRDNPVQQREMPSLAAQPIRRICHSAAPDARIGCGREGS